MSSSMLTQVGKIRVDLDKLIQKSPMEEDDVLSILNRLKDMPLTLDILLKTKIGLTVNNVRKNSSSPTVTTLSKSLIMKWKRHLTNDNGSKSSKNDKEVTEKKTTNDFKGCSANSTEDPVRLKCRSMISEALRSGNSPDDKNASFADEIGALIEQEIFLNLNSKTDMAYKNRIRGRVMNLKDSKNPQLRQNILSGIISPSEFATMSTADMANGELKTLRAQMKKESIEESQLATTTGTHTTQIKCGKCKAHDVLYNQLQTRSADEPMTTFCLCNACGARWKFC